MATLAVVSLVLVVWGFMAGVRVRAREALNEPIRVYQFWKPPLFMLMGIVGLVGAGIVTLLHLL
jgi:hypothetical protein